MSREELQQKSRFAMIGTLMTIVSLVFLFYVGSSLGYAASFWHFPAGIRADGLRWCV